jgi:transcriptional regulator with GAF, ATPase, and Fis domain
VRKRTLFERRIARSIFRRTNAVSSSAVMSCSSSSIVSIAHDVGERLRREMEERLRSAVAGGEIELIGKSEAMEEVRRAIVCAARRGETSVVISGETGTGKELIARAIHGASGRGGRFVAVNCAAIAETLAESELFGHVRGAFTGASESRTGLIRAAEGGTAFLDEIGEASPGMQAKLLRVIEEKTVVPVGTERGVAVDVRFIAATNRDLRSEMEAGRFRADLYYRLAGAEIVAPPLRERTEDVEELAEYFLAGTGSGRRFTAGALAALEEYEWPGNVRELKNAVERVAQIGAGRITEKEVRMRRGGDVNRVVNREVGGNGIRPGDGEKLETFLRRAQRLAAVTALNREGSMRRAARALECDFRTLQKILAEE